MCIFVTKMAVYKSNDFSLKINLTEEKTANDVILELVDFEFDFVASFSVTDRCSNKNILAELLQDDNILPDLEKFEINTVFCESNLVLVFDFLNKRSKIKLLSLCIRELPDELCLIKYLQELRFVRGLELWID